MSILKVDITIVPIFFLILYSLLFKIKICHKYFLDNVIGPKQFFFFSEYCMENVVSRGVTGSKAKFIIDLGKHSLSFTTKLQDSIDTVEANLPSEASIDLPNVHITAEYIQVKY